MPLGAYPLVINISLQKYMTESIKSFSEMKKTNSSVVAENLMVKQKNLLRFDKITAYDPFVTHKKLHLKRNHI